MYMHMRMPLAVYTQSGALDHGMAILRLLHTPISTKADGTKGRQYIKRDPNRLSPHLAP